VALLGQMLSPRNEAAKKTDVLSGGEAAHILFCKLTLQKPNVLVQDEPTNHLDLESIRLSKNLLGCPARPLEGIA